MTDLRITIIGAGPRALNVIERLSWKLQEDPTLPPITVHLVDPGIPCAGAHLPSQSRLLLTNTLASQVTMFSTLDPDDPLSGSSGPSFTEWAHTVGYRRVGSGYEKSMIGGDPVGELDYLPRAMLGEYLAFAHRRILAGAPKTLRVTHHRSEATDVTEEPLFVHLADGTTIACDAAIIATGHCETLPTEIDARRQGFVEANWPSNPNLAYIRSVYPTSRLAALESSAVVAIQGLGLTAYDVIAELTVGRGGSFDGSEASLRYGASGREPKLLLFSRQSLPYNARGVNQKGVDGGYRARFLTADAVAAIRTRRLAATGDARIEFRADIIPLLRKDMAFAHRCAAEGREIDPEGFEPTAEEDAVLDTIVSPRDLLGCNGLNEFRGKIVAHLKADLEESLRGNVSSPRKAATDAVRDLRAGLAAAIEFGGLLPDAHRFVAEHFIALTNRITFGPPLRRNAELLALVEAGIVDWAGGPGATVTMDEDVKRFVILTPFAAGISRVEVDALVVARVFGHRPEEDCRPLSRNMVARGLARPFCNGNYHPYGLDVDRRMRLVRSDGAASNCMWAIGYVTEGPRFHTHALPRPRRASTQLSDAAALVDDLLGALLARRVPKTEIKHPTRILVETEGP